MASKKSGTSRKKSTKKRSSKKGSSSKSAASPRFIDPRAMEKTLLDMGRLLEQQNFSSIDEANAFLQQFTHVDNIPRPTNLTPLEQAQDLMYEAWNATGKRRVALARQALEISPDCADAYVLLAEETARTPEEARDLYEQGMKAGERALGAEAFTEGAGDFWGVIETRPYMRAREGLAQSLWVLGERQQAIEHYTDMLRLNPNDNQGIRYVLATCLLKEGADEALGKLLAQYEDDAAAVWMYTRALWKFRQEGASEEANDTLVEAFEQNPFVPLYLTTIKELPNRRPAYIGFGDENEAAVYVVENAEAWLETPGAIEWFASVFLKEVEESQDLPM